jgi:hypothetical protein
MNADDNQPSEWLLLACGSSGHWSIDVDESLAGTEFEIQFQSPTIYLNFRLANLDVLSTVKRFLQSVIGTSETHAVGAHTDGIDSELNLGTFGSAPVFLVRDNEDFPRCFLKVYGQSDSVLFVNLYEPDIQMLIAAITQVLDDLSHD